MTSGTSHSSWSAWSPRTIQWSKSTPRPLQSEWEERWRAQPQDPEQVAELMKATYDYMRVTGMRYASAEGVPVTIGDIRTTIQTVRLPRDVILSNNGLCIEL